MKGRATRTTFFPELIFVFVATLVCSIGQVTGLGADHVGRFGGCIIVELLGFQLLTENFLQIRNTRQRRIGICRIATQIINVLLLIGRIGYDDLARRDC